MRLVKGMGASVGSAHVHALLLHCQASHLSHRQASPIRPASSLPAHACRPRSSPCKHICQHEGVIPAGGPLLHVAANGSAVQLKLSRSVFVSMGMRCWRVHAACMAWHGATTSTGRLSRTSGPRNAESQRLYALLRRADPMVAGPSSPFPSYTHRGNSLLDA